MSVDVDTGDRVAVHFRATPETRDAIDVRARELGVSRSQYVRMTVLRELNLPMEPARAKRVAGGEL